MKNEIFLSNKKAKKSEFLPKFSPEISPRPLNVLIFHEADSPPLEMKIEREFWGHFWMKDEIF